VRYIEHVKADAYTSAAVPKLFGLQTPFAVKYFSQTPWWPGQYQRYLGISIYYSKKPTVKMRKALL